MTLAGSPSAPFAITTAGPERDATERSLRAVGNPAPPRPVRPDRSTRSIRLFAVLRPPRAAAQRRGPVQPLMLAEAGGPVLGGAGDQARHRESRRPVGGDDDSAHRAPARAADTTRQNAAPATIAMQATVSSTTHSVRRSVPMPRPWARATGQHR